MSEIITIMYIRSPMWRPENPEQAKELIGGTMMSDAFLNGVLSAEGRFQVKFRNLPDIQRFVEQSTEDSFHFYRSGVHMYTLIKNK
tara:strand:- start:1527 stop:1784 length:258 start_codon:yes stop_codon:yes gene_type:complete